MPRPKPHSTPHTSIAPIPATGMLALASAFALLAVASLRQLWATDLGWQLAAGRLVLASGPPHVDSLSYTFAGRPWVELRWLWCALVAALWDGPGPAALSWLAAVLHVGAFTLATAARLRRATLAAAGALLALAVLAASQRLFARPEAVTGLLFAAFLCTLDRDRRRPSRVVWLLVPLQILWVNAHTLFALGPATAVLALIAAGFEAARPGGGARDRVRRSAVLALALLAACVVNPWGIRVFGFALGLVRELADPVARDVIAELRSPLALRSGYTAIAFWLALVAATVGVAAVRVRRLDPFLTLAWLATLAASFGSVRNLPLFAIASLPFALAALEPASPSVPRSRGVVLASVLAALTLGTSAWFGWAIVTDRFAVDQHDTNRFGAGVVPLRYPEESARFVAALRDRDGRAPRVFASLFESSWLLTEGVASWADPRLEVFGAPHLAKGVEATRSSAAFAALASASGARVAMASLDDADFLRALRGAPGWALVHLDPVAAVFADTSAVPARALGPGDFEPCANAARASLPPPLARHALPPLARATSAAPYQRFGNALLLLARRADLAEPFLRDAVAAAPASANAHLAWAEALEARGASGNARAERERAVALAPDDPVALTTLALQELLEGRVAAAAPRLEHAVAKQPGHALAWALLGEVRAQQGRRAEAVSCLERAVRLEPANEQFRRRLVIVRG